MNKVQKVKNILDRVLNDKLICDKVDAQFRIELRDDLMDILELSDKERSKFLDKHYWH